jgi:hypothetical protein
MAISKIVQNSLDTDSISLGPKIQSVQVANSTYVVKDDTAVNTGGGYIVVTGSGFTSNSQILIGSNTACSVTFVSATQLRAQVPSATPGSYPVYVVTGDGGTAIRINALTYSDSPTWVTTSPLAGQLVDTAFSIQLSATGANTYVLQTGSTLPSGVSLAANGLLSGTVTGLDNDTTYNFTVEAIDAENQESPKALAVTITGADPYFNLTTLYLNGDGTNGANNNVFADSSNNNLAITRNGNTSQGTFSPFSPVGFGAYFDGSDDSYSVPESADFRFGTGDFTMEAWLWIEASANSQLAFHWNGSSNGDITGSTNVLPNQWNHCAITRTGTTIRFWVNGVQDSAGALTVSSTIYNNNDPLYIGRGADHSAGSGRDICHCGEVGGGANKWFWYLRSGGTGFFKGYMSNFRLSNSVRYTTTFTPSTIDLTNDANTKLLTLNRNRPLDLSSSARVVTSIGGVTTTNFSPFKPTAAYSATDHGGSAYFDGTGDYLQATAGAVPAIGTGDFTISGWYYLNENKDYQIWFDFRNGSDATVPYLYSTSTGSGDYYVNGSHAFSGTVLPKQWYYLVVSRVSGTTKAFLNGTEVMSFADSSNYIAGRLNLGLNNPGPTFYYFNGYISNFKVVIGTGTTSGTPPASPATATSGTQALLNFTNAAILDSSTRNVIETSGNVSLNTAVKKYGTGSIAFDGNADILKTTPGISHLYAFGRQDFTVEGWFYFNALGNYSLIDWRSNPVSDDPAFYTDASGYIGWYANQSNRILSSTIPAANQWHHLAVSRSGTSTRLFINGTQSGSTYTDTFNYGCASGRPWFGALADGTGTLYYNGLIDDVRITKGYARYTTTFTPPTGPFPRR